MKNFLRDYVAGLVSPTSLVGIFLILSLIFIFRKKEKVGKIFLILASFTFFLFSFDPLPEFLLSRTENTYPAFQAKNHPNLKYVVVLAGGFAPYHNHPLTTELTPHTLARLVEGIRIQRELPGSILVVTGKGPHKKTEAEAMKEMAVKLGVDEARIIMETESTNTFEHTKYLKPILKENPFVLVTSAIHMPRAAGFFTKAGYQFIPAPTAHLLLGEYKIMNNKSPYAKGDNLAASDIWSIEFWGRVWGQAKGDI